MPSSAEDAAAPSLGLVFLADQTLPAVEHSLTAHVECVNLLVGAGVAVGAMLIAHSPDPEVAKLLRSVEGAGVTEFTRFQGTGASWEAVWTETDEDLLYLCTANSVPATETLAHLYKRLATDPSIDVALPGSGAPPAALVRRSALAAVAATRSKAFRAHRQPILVIQELVERLTSLGRGIAVVPEAPVNGLPLRQEPAVLTAKWATAELKLADPKAVTVGPYTYFTGRNARLVTVSPLERIVIGAYCSIADEVRLVNPHDPRDPVTRDDGTASPVQLRLGHRPWTATTLPVGNRLHHLDGFDDDPALTGRGKALTVGNDVWIGYGALVVGPVTIGDGAIIGAGAVVTSDVAPYSVVVGNPATVLRPRYDAATVAAFLRIRWWDWPENVVMERAESFLLPAEEFAARYDPARGLTAVAS